MDTTTFLAVLLALGAGLAAAGAVAVVAARRLSRRLRHERDRDRHETLEALRGVLAQEGSQVSSAVETVLGLAGDKLGDHLDAGTRELDARSTAIEKAIDQQRVELHRVSELVANLQRERAEQHGQLMSGLQEAAQQSRLLAGTTQQLREALASPKARGQWGERMADDVLRLAGMIEGVNYRKQTALPSGTIPDVTFLMPEDRLLNMDVKFPVDNYLRHLEAESDPERDQARDQFLRDVRHRIKEITTRGYVDPEHTVDFVLLFIPNESVYSFVHEHDPGVLDHALERRVILCSPFTLFAVIGVVRQAMDSFRLERTSDEILQVLAGFTGEWERFTDRMEKLGKHLTTVQSSYDELSGPRRRQLERKLDHIDDLRHRRGLACDDEASEAGIRHLREVGAG